MDLSLRKADALEKLASKIRVCVRCPLWKGRQNAVPGDGDIDASVLFVGEAPGYWEDVEGIPFVGSAGKILDGLLEEIGLRREHVFITNVVKCRPPRNREPKPLEVSTCTKLYLNRQIVSIEPKVIVCLGRHSAAYILSKAGFEKVESITKLRGNVYKMKFMRLPVTVAPMYHPASVLHNPMYKDDLERDFQLLRTELERQKIL